MRLSISLLIVFLPCFSFAEVNIRLKNETDHDMHNVSVNFRGRIIEYGFVGKGNYSKYFKVDHAYRYASVRWTVDDATKRVVPVDYVGEKELERGKYTYVIQPLKGADSYWIDLKED